MKKIILLVAALLVFANGSAIASLSVGKQAAEFKLNSVNMEKSVGLSDFKGEKVVVVGLFHICDPCRKQIVELIKVKNQFKGKAVEVLGINTAGSSIADVKDFLNSVHGDLSFPFLVDPDKTIDSSYNVRMTPIVIIIGKDGKITGKVFFGSSESIIKRVNELL